MGGTAELPIPNRAQRILVGMGLVLGLLAAWTGRYRMNPDGISYLDLGDDLFAGNWRGFANAHWSPVYPALLGAAVHVLKPSPQWEFPVAHLVNYGIYVGALFAFGAFFREFRAYVGRPSSEAKESTTFPFEHWVMVPGHVLFFWAALVWVGLALVTPDMLVLAMVLWALSLVLRFRRNPSVGSVLRLGPVLGIGYLCKAPLGVLAPVALVGCLALPELKSRQRRGRHIGLLVLALVVFLAIALPWPILLSQKYGQFTISESGRLNQIWQINRSAPSLHWQGGPVSGTAEHATRIIQDSPRIYEFATPIGGTYPPWKDPAYWMAGARAHADARETLRAMVGNTRELARSLWGSPFAAVLALLGLGFLMAVLRERAGVAIGRLVETLGTLWPLLLYGIAGVTMYLAVLVEMRYLAPFFLVLFICLAAAVAASARRPKSGTWFSVGAALLLGLGYLPALLRDGNEILALSVGARSPTGSADAVALGYYHQHVAEELQRLGVRRGTPIGFVGGPALHAYWARLGHWRIVAEMPRDQAGMLAQPGALARSLEAFRKAGASDVVAFAALLPNPDSLGTPIPESGLVLFRLGAR